jgi:hypothetical protein
LTVIRDELRATEAVPASLLAVGLAAAAVWAVPVSPARSANRLSPRLNPTLGRAVSIPSIAGRAQAKNPSAPATTNLPQRASQGGLQQRIFHTAYETFTGKAVSRVFF